jgi:hypothetical protein
LLELQTELVQAQSALTQAQADAATEISLRIDQCEAAVNAANHRTLLAQAEAASTARPTTHTPKIEKSEKLPDPDPYNADGKDALKSWSIAIYLKLSANRDRYPENHDKLCYMYSRLGPKARAIMVPYVRIDRGVGDEPAVKFTVNTVAEFEAILVSAFGDTNEEATALAKLEKLKQGSREFSHYRSDFNTCNAIVGFTGLALRVSFRRGLSSELRDMWAG